MDPRTKIAAWSMDHRIKVTAAGYLYIDGVKVRTARVTPLSIPTDFGPAAESVCREYARKKYTLTRV